MKFAPRRSAFSLIEVTLAIGIIGFALLAIFALIPVGLTAGRDAVDATRASLIAQDLRSRCQNAVTGTTFLSSSDIPLGPWYYDREGVFLQNPTSDPSAPLYQVIGMIHGTWSASPPYVDASVLRPVTATLAWPVNASTQTVSGDRSLSFTFYVRRP